MGKEKEPACLGSFGVEGVPNLRYINIRRDCNFGKSFRPERGLKIFEPGDNGGNWRVTRRVKSNEMQTPRLNVHRLPVKYIENRRNIVYKYGERGQ